MKNVSYLSKAKGLSSILVKRYNGLALILVTAEHEKEQQVKQ